MTSTELFTLIISGIAIMASFVSIYFQFFHRKTAILGKLLLTNYQISDDNFDQELNYSLSNLGNQEVLLSDVEYLDWHTTRGRAYNGYSVHKYKCPDSPCVLKPGEIKLLKVCTKKETGKRLPSRVPKKKETGKSLPGSDKRFFIMFVFTSSEGKNSEIFHDITKLHSKDHEEEKLIWKPFTLKETAKEKI